MHVTIHDVPTSIDFQRFPTTVAPPIGHFVVLVAELWFLAIIFKTA